jgi:hypothetical protein
MTIPPCQKIGPYPLAGNSSGQCQCKLANRVLLFPVCNWCNRETLYCKSVAQPTLRWQGAFEEMIVILRAFREVHKQHITLYSLSIITQITQITHITTITVSSYPVSKRRDTKQQTFFFHSFLVSFTMTSSIRGDLITCGDLSPQVFSYLDTEDLSVLAKVNKASHAAIGLFLLIVLFVWLPPFNNAMHG